MHEESSQRSLFNSGSGVRGLPLPDRLMRDRGQRILECPVSRGKQGYQPHTRAARSPRLHTARGRRRTHESCAPPRVELWPGAVPLSRSRRARRAVRRSGARQQLLRCRGPSVAPRDECCRRCGRPRVAALVRWARGGLLLAGSAASNTRRNAAAVQNQSKIVCRVKLRFGCGQTQLIHHP